jgi:transcriptional regulator with XRE-family HTH domain
MPVPLPTPETLGRVVRRHRHERGLTLEGLAELAGMNVTYLSDIERGKANPSVFKLGGIAAALEVRVSDLLREAEELATRPAGDGTQWRATR